MTRTAHRPPARTTPRRRSPTTGSAGGRDSTDSRAKCSGKLIPTTWPPTWRCSPPRSPRSAGGGLRLRRRPPDAPAGRALPHRGRHRRRTGRDRPGPRGARTRQRRLSRHGRSPPGRRPRAARRARRRRRLHPRRAASPPGGRPAPCRAPIATLLGTTGTLFVKELAPDVERYFAALVDQHGPPPGCPGRAIKVTL